jgi:RHS repeat-associated protein
MGTTFKYDGLNRQVSRTVGGTTTYSVYDGWDLIEEYQGAGVMTAGYVYGAGALILDTQTGNADFNYYYQDASGSTSHIADSSGNLLEWYRYDLQGTPFFYAPNDTQLSASNYSVRHLFTGQQWYKDIGLYDLRNRFYSPDIGRFLQPDPIDFDGDPTNLYRYCGNNPTNAADPIGLWQATIFGGAGWGLYLTFGHNSGQWSFGAYGGYGRGLVGSYNHFDQGAHAEGEYVGLLAAGGYHQGWSGVSSTSYIGQGGNSATLAGRLGSSKLALNGGFKVSQTGAIRPTGDGIAAGSGGFIGGGYSIYLNDEVPEGPTVIPGAGDIIYYRDEKPVAMTPGPIEVVAPPIYQGSSSGGPTWGNGVGIFDTAGFNAQYTSNFYGYTGSLPTTLANPFGSWGMPSLVPPIKGSIFGPNNYYSGLDPNAAFGHIYEGNPIGAGEGPYVPVRFK